MSGLAAALVAFQAELPTVVKGNTATVQPKEGGRSYSYAYADLQEVSAIVLPLLARHGLAFSASPTVTADQGFVLQYRLVHADSDEELAGSYPLPGGGTPQAVGSAITYARRYALCAVTGVAPGGDDDDAQRAEQSVPTHRDWLAEAQRSPSVEGLRKVWRDATAAGAPSNVVAAIEELAVERAGKGASDGEA